MLHVFPNPQIPKKSTDVLVEINQEKENEDGLSLQKGFKEKKNQLEEMVQILKYVQDIVLLLVEVLKEKKQQKQKK